MPTMLVTGAAGFLGSHLCRALLDRGDRVVGVDCFDPYYPPARKRANIADLVGRDGFTLIEGDVLDPALAHAIADPAPDAVLHFAALAGVRPSVDRAPRYCAVNVEGLARVLDAARLAGCRRAVFASSSSVYGDRPDGAFAETDPVDAQVSPYAATKRAGELLCGTWSGLHGMRIAMTRLFTVYGPAQRPDLAISRFLERVARDEPVPVYGDGAACRDYTCVDDVVAGVLAALDWTDDGAAACRAFNLGSARPVALLDLVDLVGRTVGRRPIVDRRPPRAGDVGRTCADLARSRAELGYAPRVTLEDGLARQWAWMRDQRSSQTRCAR